jgi:hypothetical protein
VSTEIAGWPLFPKGIKVGKQAFAAIQLRPDTFHGEWNYTTAPLIMLQLFPYSH